uniref:Uncharacterized protein n=1 Tax=Glossina pallidipes TaxID=7398 RepID=A0A1A9ZAK1_GLOPL
MTDYIENCNRIDLNLHRTQLRTDLTTANRKLQKSCNVNEITSGGANLLFTVQNLQRLCDYMTIGVTEREAGFNGSLRMHERTHSTHTNVLNKRPAFFEINYNGEAGVVDK